MDVLLELKELEEELLRSSVRRDGVRVRSMLHEDFREFGSSGRMFTREEIVAELADEMPREVALAEFRAERLEGETWLVTYRAVREDGGASLRCSVWQRIGGRWQMRFHQGTRVGSAVDG